MYKANVTLRNLSSPYLYTSMITFLSSFATSKLVYTLTLTALNLIEW
jgi:hypothetical protein